MCGRFSQKLSPREVYDLYGVIEPPPSFAREPRYNGAPTQDFAVCRVDDGGWFEWQGPGRARQPYYLTPADGSTLSLAAVWERWEAREQVIESFIILTTPAAAELVDIHHRQPAIVAPEWFADWLDPSTPARQLLDHLSTAHSGPYERRPVSTRVNSVVNDDPDLLRPVGEQLRLI